MEFVVLAMGAVGIAACVVGFVRFRRNLRRDKMIARVMWGKE